MSDTTPTTNPESGAACYTVPVDPMDELQCESCQ